MALVGVLLVVSAWWDGAFDLRYWAPLTILALAMLVAQAATGGLLIPRRGPLAVATVAIWAFAGYVLLSAAWSESAALAWEDAARTTFYAALWTLVIAAGIGRWRDRFGIGLFAGVGVVAVVTLAGLFVDGADLFLAGRLDSPIGYRNGTAALFAFAVWPLIGVAARRGLASGIRAAAFAVAVLALGLAFLTQSRGVLIGFAAGAAVSLAIGPDRLRRSWAAIAAVGAIGVASGSMLTPFDAFDGGAGVASEADIRTAATALAVTSALCFLAGLFVFVFDNGLRSPAFDLRLRQLGAGALVILSIGVGALGVARIGNPVSYVNDKLEEFEDIEPEAVTGSTRLGTVSGQRSDLWGVAWDQFRENPLAGMGAGSYQFAYYRDRQTDRNLSDPHSLPLKLLSETGLIGFALFAVWLGAVGMAIARRARAVTPRDRMWVAGLAAAGATVLAQCLTDWLWLLPGLLGLSVLALSLAAAGDQDEEVGVGVASGRSRWSVGRIAGAAALAAALVSVTFLFLSDLYVRKAREDAFRSSQAALDSARTAAWLNPVSITPLYLQASALETQGDRAAARQSLQDALDPEPTNFVTLGLLGDLEVRGGNAAAARRHYQRALALNPQDVGLRELSGGAAD